MDPITQGAIGSSISLSFARKNKLDIAAICGLLAGTAPDLDVLIRSNTDPLLALEFHRQFTHALIFIPFGAAIVALFLWGLFFKNRASFKLVYLSCFLGYATHGLLDACTSYGTYLYWPFSNYRVTWNLISIVDPIFTLSLIIGVVFSLYKNTIKPAFFAFIFAMLYLGYGYYQHQTVANFINQVALERGHKIEKIFLNQTLANNLLWRSVYLADGNYYVDAVRAIPSKSPQLIVGSKVPAIDVNKIMPELGDNSIARKDIKRFAHFAKSFVYMQPGYDNIIADLRYSALPYGTTSLWGIKINPQQPEKHVRLVYINIKDRNLHKLWLLIQGKVDS